MNLNLTLSQSLLQYAAVPQREEISFRNQLNKIQQLIQQSNIQGFDNAKNEQGGNFLKNIAQCTMYFKPPVSGISLQKLFDQANPLKWGGKQVVSPRLANDLVMEFSSKINIDELQSFDILESYFVSTEKSRKLLVYLITLDQNLAMGESQLAGIQLSSTLFQQRHKNVETWKREFVQVVAQAVSDAQLYYLQERICLLQCILAFLNYPGSNLKASACIKEMLTLGLEKNLLDNLDKNLDEVGQIFIEMTCNLRDVTGCLQKEEIVILQCLFMIYRNYETPQCPQIVQFLKYQKKTNFRGIKLRPQDFQSDETLKLQSQIILALNMQQMFAFFQIHEFTAPNPTKNQRLKKFIVNLFGNEKNFQDLGKLLMISDDKQVDDISAIILITFSQIIEIIKKLDLLKEFGQLDKAQLLPPIQKEINKTKQELLEFRIVQAVQEIIKIENYLEEESMFGSQRDDLHFIIQDWINLVFSFFKANNLGGQMKLAQQMTFNVISSPAHLKRVWEQIGKSREGNLIGIQNGGAPVDKYIYHTLDIFEEVLQKPFHFENISEFTKLMKALCGNKKNKYSLDVSNLLQTNQMALAQPENKLNSRLNVLQHLIIQFFMLTQAMEQERISSTQKVDYLNIVALICKMIGQNSLLYMEFNSEALLAKIKLDSNQQYFDQEVTPPRRDPMRYDEFADNHPLLWYILRAFNVIIQTFAVDEATETLKYIINSLTTIYKKNDLQYEILKFFDQNQNSDGVPTFIEYFLFNLNENDTQKGVFTLTKAYVRFIDAIFAKPYPQQYLQIELQVNISDSILQKFLFLIYQNLITCFKELQFTYLKDCLKLYYQLLKLTNRLLSKFKDVQPLIKAPLSNRYPQYDELLKMITQCLNLENIDSLIINSLMLAEDNVKGQMSGLTNRLWLEQLKQGTHFEDSEQRLRMQKLTSQALTCLNTLLELSYLQIQTENLPPEKKQSIGSRQYYTSKLQCVVNITNVVKYPGQWEQYQLQSPSQVTYSLFNIVQYYVKPHLNLCPFMTNVQIEALKFFFICTKIWETQPLGQRVSLESTLRTLGMTNQEIRMKYVSNFMYSLKSLGQSLPLRYVASFLDLLIMSCSTQAQFVNDIFKEVEMVKIFTDRLLNKSVLKTVNTSSTENEQNPAMRALAFEVQSKVVILLAEMASNKICDSFLSKLNTDDYYSKIYNNIITLSIDECHKQPIIDYQGEEYNEMSEQQPITIANDIINMDLFLINQSFITIKYFMRLLADEYQKDISQCKSVKKTIQVLYQNVKLIQVIESNIKSKLIINQMFQINDFIKNFEDKPKELLRELQQNIEATLTHEQADMLRTTRLVTDDNCSVYLNNLDCTQLMQYLKEVHPYTLIQPDSLMYSQYSKLGSNFMINVEELIQTAKIYMYQDLNLLAQLKKSASCYNMAVSYLFGYQQFISGHQDFILSIGKAKMRDNMRNKDCVIQNLTFSTSLLNLVQVEDVGKDETKAAIRHLGDLLINIASLLTKKLIPKERIVATTNVRDIIMQEDIPHFELYQTQNELDLDFMGVILGSLNSLGDSGKISHEILSNLEKGDIIPNLIRGLPKIRQSQMLTTCKKDIPQFIMLENEKRSTQLFINLVLQIFTLSARVLEEKELKNVTVQTQRQIDRVRGNIDYVHILSQVIKIMQESSGTSCFTEGLRIIEEGFCLISSENINQFMRKQDTSPLKVILQKFLGTSSTIDEKIKIIEFLTNYARTDQGAEHLQNENVFKNLSISSLVQLMNQVDFYSVDGEPKRNQIHILWCHVLLFIRTINHLLLRPDFPNYKKMISQQISFLQIRIGPLLEFGQHLKSKEFDYKALSLALYEELELITGIVSQYFNFTDDFFEVEPERFSAIKDNLLFGVLNLFTEERQSSYTSSTEQYLNGMTHDKIHPGVFKVAAFTGLTLAVDVQKIKIYFNVMSALLNLLSSNSTRIGREDFFNTWEPAPLITSDRYNGMPIMESKQMSKSGASYASKQFNVINQDADTDQQSSLSKMQAAISYMIQAQCKLSKNLKLWIDGESTLNELYSKFYGIFNNDEWINIEYQGLNSYFVGQTFQSLIEQFGEGLQMGYLATSMVLSQLKETFDYADQQGLVYSYSMSGAVQYVTTQMILDYGEQIVKDQRDFENELQKAKKMKLPTNNSGMVIADFVEGLKRTTQDRHVEYMQMNTDR